MSQSTTCPWWAASAMTIDLLTKPLKRGKAEIDEAPTMQNPAVQGIDL